MFTARKIFPLYVTCVAKLLCRSALRRRVARERLDRVRAIFINFTTGPVNINNESTPIDAPFQSISIRNLRGNENFLILFIYSSPSRSSDFLTTVSLHQLREAERLITSRIARTVARTNRIMFAVSKQVTSLTEEFNENLSSVSHLTKRNYQYLVMAFV